MKKYRFWFSIWGALFIAGCAGMIPKPYMRSGVPHIRVLLFETRNMDILLQSDWFLSTQYRENIHLPQGDTINIQITPDNEALNIFSNERLLFTTNQDVHIYSSQAKAVFKIGHHKYYGNIQLVIKNREIHVINELDIETYVKGVVPAELGTIDAELIEAAKAQAVASRTFALKKVNMAKTSNQLYDLTAYISDQVYNGIYKNTKWTDQAVEQTFGEVAMYKNQLIDAFFCSTCGGRTEFGKNIFSADREYLQGVADDFGNGEFCSGSPYFRWTESFDLQQIVDVLRTNYPAFFSNINVNDGIQDIIVTNRFPSGRVHTLAVYFKSSDNVLYLHGEDIRRVFLIRENKLLESLLFKISKQESDGELTTINFIGAGNGHGVGLCQWGARGMAKQGYSFDQIIRHYYRGVKIRKIY